MQNFQLSSGIVTSQPVFVTLPSAPTISNITYTFLELHSGLISLLFILHEEYNTFGIYNSWIKRSNISYLFIYAFAWLLQVSIDWNSSEATFKSHYQSAAKVKYTYDFCTWTTWAVFKFLKFNIHFKKF